MSEWQQVKTQDDLTVYRHTTQMGNVRYSIRRGDIPVASGLRNLADVEDRLLSYRLKKQADNA